MKKSHALVSACLSFTLVVGLAPSLAFAELPSARDESLAAQAGNILSGTWGTCPWEIDADGTLTVHPGEAASDATWRTYSNLIERVVFLEEAGQRVVLPSGWVGLSFLNNMPYLRSVDLSGLDTSNVTSMGNMFDGCSSLVSLDLSGLDTSNVTSMGNMFEDCSSLASLDLSGLDTSNVTSMGCMFSGCSSLASLDLSGLDTSLVTDMGCMFSGCSSLASFDLSSFDTSRVVDMYGMFSGCSSLASLDLSGLDTSRVTDMRGMFDGCSSLASLDLSSFDTSRVAEMYVMFSGCECLTSVKLGRKFASIDESSQLPSGSWRSKGNGNAYTAHQVATERKNVPDAYTREMVITDISQSDSIYIYDGMSKVPTITARSGDRELVKGTDYTVTNPSDSRNAGTKTLIVSGTGAYRGKLDASYTIKPAVITSLELSETKLSYDGTSRVPDIVVRSGYMWLEPGVDYDVIPPSDSVNIGTKSIKVVGKGNYEGTLEAAYEITNSGRDVSGGSSSLGQPSIETMYRLYNPNSGEHFYTSSPVERQAVIDAGWNDEGIGWTAPTQGIQVYRLYNSFAGEHHYTTSAEERDMLVSVGWTWEEGGWFSDPNEAVPLYRAYNPNAYANNHHYTLDWGEFQTLLSLGWRDEGVGWHGVR